jgi:hypothetical protein
VKIFPLTNPMTPIDSTAFTFTACPGPGAAIGRQKPWCPSRGCFVFHDFWVLSGAWCALFMDGLLIFHDENIALGASVVSINKLTANERIE